MIFIALALGELSSEVHLPPNRERWKIRAVAMVRMKIFTCGHFGTGATSRQAVQV